MLTNEINNALGDAQSASSLDTAAELNNVGTQRLHRRLLVRGGIDTGLNLGKVLRRQVGEAGANGQTDQVLGGCVFALLGDLDLQLAGAKAQVHDGLAAGTLVGRGHVGFYAGGIFLDLVPASDAEVDTALADESRDIGGGEENQGDGEVLDEGNVEAVLAAELNIGALEEVQGGGIEATLWTGSSVQVSNFRIVLQWWRQRTLGDRKQEAAFEAIREKTEKVSDCRGAAVTDGLNEGQTRASAYWLTKSIAEKPKKKKERIVAVCQLNGR